MAQCRAYKARNSERLKAHNKAYREANKEAIAAAQRARYEAKREIAAERTRAYRQVNRETMLARERAWREENRHLVRANSIKRRMRRKVATPPWADREQMAAIYRQARDMRAAGQDVHVDHEIPLQGKLVSGLHVHTNLRIIPAAENAAKGNKV